MPFFRSAAAVLFCLGLALAVAVAPAQAAKADTKAFNAYYASQSSKIYDHLLKVTDYYSSLTRGGNADRIKDVLALRASLSACWELFLNAGDMVYIHDLLDPSCTDSVNRIKGMVKNGLGVIAGKLDKEVQWMRLVEKNVADLPVSTELAQALRDIEAAAAYLRSAGAVFDTGPGSGDPRQPARK